MSKKILMVGLVVILLLVSSVSLAAGDFPSVTPNTGAIENPNASGVRDGVTQILGVAQWIGFIVGIAMIIWVGVKYLTAGAGTKAQVKSTMIPILVGAFLVALAPTIAVWLFNAFGSK